MTKTCAASHRLLSPAESDVANGGVTPAFLQNYRRRNGAWDEFLGGGGDAVRSEIAPLARLFPSDGEGGMANAAQHAAALFRERGITFGTKVVEGRRMRRLLSFDPIPRIILPGEWDRIERGLVQRVRALNAFLDDVYGAQRILASGRLPAEIVRSAPCFFPGLVGVPVSGGVRAHVAGIDLVRRPDGEFVVLEDNLRIPSGASYALEVREVMEAVFPREVARASLRTLHDYPRRLRECVAGVAPGGAEPPRIAVLTLGAKRCPAYFEDSRLAEWLGCARVGPLDLFLRGDRLCRRTAAGAEPVDVLYLRVAPGMLHRMLVRAVAAGTVALVNALGNGVADDKAVFAFVPEMIRYYLGEEPVLEQVETYLCARPAECAHVLANLASLVVKRADGAAGKSVVIGPRASRAEREVLAARIRAEPRAYVAQPLVELSTVPTWTGAEVEPRRLDLRPFVLSGSSTWVLPGGLSRIAPSPDAYVVNNSQGGGVKDTWVLAPAPAPRIATEPGRPDGYDPIHIEE